METPPATVKHTVLRGETLWSIASDHLGAGDRYPQIAALNTDVLGHRPGFLKPGWVLNLPAGDQQGQRGEHTVTVHRGDTLWEIAHEELGDPSRYPEIFETSQATTQPGGAHLADPDVIDVGWTLTIPGTTTSAKSSGPKPGEADPAKTRAAPSARRLSPVEGGEANLSAGEHQKPDGATAVEDTPNASWMLEGLAGAGAVLAGSMLLIRGSEGY